MQHIIQIISSVLNNTNPSITGKKRIGFIFCGFACLLVVCILVIYGVLMAYIDSTPKIYIDSLHYFKVTVPHSWNTEQEKASNLTGENTAHPVVQQIEISQLYNSQDEGITVQVYRGTPLCPLGQPLTTTFAGYPSAFNSLINTWTIPTTAALITITITYPGSGMDITTHYVSNTSASASKQDQEYVMGVLKSMQLTNLKTFTCQ